MKLKVYSVYDKAAEAYLQPFFMQTRGLAIRAFTSLVNDKEHLFGKHPAEYILYEIGTFEDSDASLGSEELEKVGSGTSFLAPDGELPV